MFDTDRSFCPNPDKSHLWRLPPLTEPMPTVEKPSKRGLVIYPLFQSMPGDDTVAQQAAQAAIWSKYSFLTNTDAVEQGIEVKFYIEERIADQADYVLGLNGLDESDAIYFNGEFCQGQPRNHVGKKCAFFNDQQFRDYDWVFQLDVDLFACSPGGESLPFFSKFFRNIRRDVIAVWETTCDPTLKEHLKVYEPSWMRRVLIEGTEEEMQTEWLHRVSFLAGDDVATRYYDPYSYVIKPHGAMIAFPASHFLRDRSVSCEWLQSAGRILQTDEATLSVWHTKGNPLSVIREVVPFNFVNYDAAMDLNDYEKLRRFVHEGSSFFFHYGHNPVEVAFRKGIGAV